MGPVIAPAPNPYTRVMQEALGKDGGSELGWEMDQVGEDSGWEEIVVRQTIVLGHYMCSWKNPILIIRGQLAKSCCGI